MEYITADTGGKKVYIEKDQIETILTRPEVWPVPEAEDNILGLSVYGNELVVFLSGRNRGRSSLWDYHQGGRAASGNRSAVIRRRKRGSGRAGRYHTRVWERKID